MDQFKVVTVAAIMVLSVMAGVPIVTADSASDTTASPTCEYPLNITDGTGTDVQLNESPEEIVVMHASAAQVAHDIGAWDRVTGAPVQPFTAYLDNHDEPTDVTDDEGFPVVETIVDLDPDIVMAGHVGDPDTVDTLRAENITVYMGPMPETVGDIKTKVYTYGELLDACDEAEERVDWMGERLEDAEAHVEDLEESPLAYYELGDGWTTGAGTFQHDMIERAGAENLGAAADINGWDVVDEEVVVDMEPDFIIYDDHAEEPPVSETIRSLPVFEEDRTVAVDSNLMSQAGPRVVLMVEEMAVAFSEGTLDDAETVDTVDDSDDVADETDDDAVTAEPDEEDETDDALPAFGLLAGGIALLVALVATRRS